MEAGRIAQKFGPRAGQRFGPGVGDEGAASGGRGDLRKSPLCGQHNRYACGHRFNRVVAERFGFFSAGDREQRQFREKSEPVVREAVGGERGVAQSSRRLQLLELLPQ